MKVKRLAKLLVIVVTIALLITILAGCSTSMEDPQLALALMILKTKKSMEVKMWQRLFWIQIHQT